MMVQRSTVWITIAAALIGLLVGLALLRTPSLGMGSILPAGSALAQAPTVGATEPSDHTIAVSGSGQVQAPPDTAYVTVGVQNQADTAQQAQQDNANKMAAVIGALENLKIADSDIQTSALSLQPIYSNQTQSGGQQQIVGYRATNTVTVKVTDISQAGTVLDQATQAGANTEGSIRFTIANDAGLRQQALKNAVQDARGQADAIAGGLGVTITGVHSASEVSFSTPAVQQAMPAPMAAAATTPVQPGELTITAQVQVLYDY